MLLVEPFRLKITRVNIKTEKWPYTTPLKIAVLSDFHLIWPWMTKKRLQKIVKRANSLHPNLVVLLGDYKGDYDLGKQLDPYDSLKPFEELQASCGVYAILGNHDVRSDRLWAEALSQSPIPLLANSSHKASCNEKEFYVVGIEEPVDGNMDMEKAFSNVDADYPIIFLTHNPDVFPDVPNEVTLTLAGHTHAGQVRLPFIGSIASVIPSKFGKKYDYGHIQEDNKDMYVTSGLGTTTLPIRFLNRPEIAFVTLSGE